MLDINTLCGALLLCNLSVIVFTVSSTQVPIPHIRPRCNYITMRLAYLPGILYILHAKCNMKTLSEFLDCDF